MMKRTLILFVLLAPAALAYERLQGPTELLFHDKEKAFNGYTLFGCPRHNLPDRHGWPGRPHLARRHQSAAPHNGHLLDASKDDPSGFQGFQEVDWNGKVVWEYAEKREGYAPHHDWVRIFNKKLNAPTTLYIANKSITHEQAIAAGADPRKGPYDGGQMDAIVEVDMKGNVVWEWRFFDHVVQDIDSAKSNYVGAGKTIADLSRPDQHQPAGPAAEARLAALQFDGLQRGTGPDRDQLGAGRVLRHRPRRHVHRRRSEGKHRQGRRPGGRLPLPIRRPRPLCPGRSASGAGELGCRHLRPQTDGRRARCSLDPPRPARRGSHHDLQQRPVPLPADPAVLHPGDQSLP